MKLDRITMAALSRAHCIISNQIKQTQTRKPDHATLWREIDREILGELAKRRAEIREQESICGQ